MVSFVFFLNKNEYSGGRWLGIEGPLSRTGYRALRPYRYCESVKTETFRRLAAPANIFRRQNPLVHFVSQGHNGGGGGGQGAHPSHPLSTPHGLFYRDR